jgi:Exostosin family
MPTIYTGRDFFPPDLPPSVPMVLPWRKTDDRSTAVPRIFDEYTRVAHTIFSEAPLAAATVGVLPFSWKYTLHHPKLRTWAREFSRVLAEAGKNVIIFFDSDSVEPVDIPNAIVFRTSAYRSRCRRTEFGMPGWGQCAKRKLRFRDKKAPVVGFCGYAPPLEVPLSRRKVKESIRWALVRSGIDAIVKVHPGYFTRVEAIRSCMRTSGLETNFLIRTEPSFVVDQDGWGTGRLRGNGQGSTGSFQSAFMKNMLDSDYILCTRGLGNYSFRLYEALSCGRIPVFVDTDSLLPFHENPQWHSATLWVDQRDVASIGERIVDFHTAISPKAFLERQDTAREFWDQWLAPVAFYRRLAQVIAATPSIPVDELV